MTGTPCVCPLCIGRASSWSPPGPVGVVAADTRSVGPQGTGQSGKGLWPSLVHSRLLRGWPGARVPEGRREPFKETFLCFKKKKNRQETLKHTTKLVGWLAGRPGMRSCGQWVEEALGGSRPRRGTPASGLQTGGPQYRSKSSERTRTGPGVRFHGSPLLQGGTWRREWQPTPVFFPGECHRHKNLVGYSPGGCKESDTIERLVL